MLLFCDWFCGGGGRDMINDMIKEGKIVFFEVIVRFFLKVMEDSKGDKFFIDGFF